MQKLYKLINGNLYLYKTDEPIKPKLALEPFDPNIKCKLKLKFGKGSVLRKYRGGGQPPPCYPIAHKYLA